MKTRTLIRYFLIASILLGSLPLAFVAGADVVEDAEVTLLRQELYRKKELKDSINDVKSQCEKLKAEERRLREDIKRTTADLESHQRELAHLGNKQGAMPSVSLEQQLQELQSQLVTIVQQNERLQNEVSSLGEQLDAKNQELASLETIKGQVGSSLIEQNRTYVEQPFSEMNLYELFRIKDKCDQYNTDKQVKTFARKVNNVIALKQSYDSVCQVLNQKFDRVAISWALAELNGMKGLSDLQEQEIHELKNQLNGFERGLQVFRVLISRFDERRDYMSRADDAKAELSFILNDTDSSGLTLAEGIERFVKPIPYLKKRYDEYYKSIVSSKFKVKSVAEQEIQGQ